MLPPTVSGFQQLVFHKLLLRIDLRRFADLGELNGSGLRHSG